LTCSQSINQSSADDMTHAPETGAINRLAGFCYVCHANLGPDSSGTKFRCRLEHCSIPRPGLENGLEKT